MRHALGLLVLVFTTTAVAEPNLSPPLVPAPGRTPAAAPAGASPPVAMTVATGAPLAERTTLLAPIQVASLTLTPIVATGQPAPDEPLLVLDEAMAAGKVKIREIADGDVNGLVFINRAAQPVFVMAGEVIIGGKQDRIIGRNTVIPANTTQTVPVYCVEHGRWQGNTKEFTSARALAHGRLRGQASYAQQQDVWNEVAAKNEMRKTKTASDTYRKVAQQQSDGTLGTMEKQVTTALAQLPAADRARMVGYAVALNGAVATVDVFGSPTLFQKLETKLIRSYLTEAIDVVAAKDVKPPTMADVKQFMSEVDKAAAKPSYDTAAAETLVIDGARTSKARVHYKRAPRQPAAGAAADAAPPAATPALYENYQSKSR